MAGRPRQLPGAQSDVGFRVGDVLSVLLMYLVFPFQPSGLEFGLSGISIALLLAPTKARIKCPQGQHDEADQAPGWHGQAKESPIDGAAAASGSAAPGLRVYFADGAQLRSVGVGRLAHVETAFAMTVHKSQGSEFEHTVLVLPPQAGAVLTRELLYTGITRARQAFTLVAAQPGLLATAVQQRTQRASGLQGLLERGPGA